MTYIRAHAFSLMAISNVLGDFCYLGYAFDADGFVSPIKLSGAAFTMLAHVILLAYGDDQARKIAHEGGALSRGILGMRSKAQKLTRFMPNKVQSFIKRWPVGITFTMLSMNGCALFYDAIERMAVHSGLSMPTQCLMGLLITLGCVSFAAADFVKGQKAADVLVKTAPTFFALATVAQIALASLTLNPFLMLAAMVFAASNLAGFFAKIEKEA